MENVAIVGGGITGLILGYLLSKKSYKVTLFEKDSETGGLAGAYERNGVFIDKYYRHLFQSHKELIDLIKELNLEERIIFRKAQMGYFTSGELFSLNSAMDLLRFKPLDFISRLRVGWSLSGFLFKKDWKHFDSIRAVDYLKSTCGEKGFKIFWEPLLMNKFGNCYSDVSAAWLWDRVMSRNRSRAGKSKETLGYLEGSFQVLLDRLEEEIIKHNGEIIRNCEIKKISRPPGSIGYFSLNSENRVFKKFDLCIVTVPVPHFIDIYPGLPEEYVSALENVNYAHSRCMILNLNKRLSDYYWINVGDASFPFAVIIEHTNWMNNDDYNGEHIVYISRYLNSEDDYTWKAPDDVLYSIYCRFLKKIFPHFDESMVNGFTSWREKYTQPIFKVGYSTQIPPYQTPIRDLYLVNTSQFYPMSRCMNTSIISANRFIGGLERKPGK